MSAKPEALKPLDIVVAARLALGGAWSFHGMAEELGMSSSTVHESIKRLGLARLYNPSSRRLARSDFFQFVEQGLRFVFPAHPEGPPVRGMSTSGSAPVLAGKLVTGEAAAVVWPDRKGSAVGKAIPPLHASAPRAARDNPALYDVLALIDSLRIGGAREREVAGAELRRRLS